MQKEINSMRKWAEFTKGLRRAVMTQSFIYAMDRWLRATTTGVAELDDICQRFDVSFEDAVGVSIEIGNRRRKLQAVGGFADPRAPVDMWPLGDRLELFEAVKRLFACNQAGWAVKSRWAAIWGRVSYVLRFVAVVAGVAGLVLVGYLMARAG